MYGCIVLFTGDIWTVIMNRKFIILLGMICALVFSSNAHAQHIMRESDYEMKPTPKPEPVDNTNVDVHLKFMRVFGGSEDGGIAGGLDAAYYPYPGVGFGASTIGFFVVQENNHCYSCYHRGRLHTLFLERRLKPDLFISPYVRTGFGWAVINVQDSNGSRFNENVGAMTLEGGLQFHASIFSLKAHAGGVLWTSKVRALLGTTGLDFGVEF